MPYQRIDAPLLEARDRFEYWRAWLVEPGDVPMTLEPVRRIPYDFDATAESLAVGTVDIYEYRFGAASGSWTSDAIAATGRLRLQLVAPTSAGSASWYGRQQPLDHGAALLVGETDGRLASQGGLHGIQVNVPREAVPVTDAQLAAFSDQRRLLRDPTFTGIVRPALLGMRGHLGELATGDLRELPQLWISLLSMLTRSLAGQDTGGSDTLPARRLQIDRHIDAHLGDPRLSPASIAAALHISRSTLYAAFDADGVAAEIRRRRLDRAHALLQDPAGTLPIAAVAARVGIPDAARFSRAFRRRYGITPSELRRTAAGP